MANILLIEDDTTEGNIVKDFLTSEQHAVDYVASGMAALESAHNHPYDLVVLDLGLPDIGGMDVLKTLRSEGFSNPVLILTGRSKSEEIIVGLDSGADDYLTKPFNIMELAARVRSLLRRSWAPITDILQYGYVSLDSQNHRVTISGTEVTLLPKEFALLEYMLRNQNRVFSADTLLKNVWKSGEEAGPEMVRTCMSRLRQRIEVDGVDSIIETVYGVGYRLRRLMDNSH